MATKKLDIPISVKAPGAEKTLKTLNKDFVQFRASVRKALKPVTLFGQGLSSLKNRVFSIQGAFVGLTGFLAGRGIKAMIDQADAIGKLARQTGDAVEDLSALDFAMQASGFRAEDLRTIMTGLGRSVSAALGGGKLQIGAFTELGIGIDSLRQKGAVEILRDMAEGLERIGLADQKRILKDIFPDNFQKVLPLIGDGVKSFEQLLSIARQSGAIITDRDVKAAEEFNDALLGAQTALTGLFRAFATEFAGDAAQILKGITAVVREEGDVVRELLKGLARFASTSIEGLLEVMVLGVRAAELFKDTRSSEQLDAARERLAAVENRVAGSVDRRAAILRSGKFSAFQQEQEQLQSLRNLRDALRKEVEALEKDTPQLSQRLAEVQKQIALNIARFQQGQETDKVFGSDPQSFRDVFAKIAAEREKAERDFASAGDGTAPQGINSEAFARTILALERDKLTVAKQVLGLSEDTIEKRREEVRVASQLFEAQTRLRAIDDPTLRAQLDTVLAANREQELRQIEELNRVQQEQQQQTRLRYLDAKVSALELLEPTEEITDQIRQLSVESQGLKLKQALAEAGVEAELIAKVLDALNKKAVGGNERGFADGFTDALQSIEDRFGSLASVGSQVGDVLVGAFDGVGTILSNIGDDAQDTKQAFKDLAVSVARDIGKILIQAGLTAAFGGGGLGGLLFSAKGNAFDRGRVIPFARGGVLDRPTFFGLRGNNVGVAGEAGPEAVVPLKRMRDNSLGVSAEVGGGGGGTLVIQIMTPDPRAGLAYIQSQREPIRAMFHDFLAEGGPTRRIVMNGGRRA